MKRIMRAAVAAATLVCAGAVRAQNPTPPATPVAPRVTRPAPAPTPAIAPAIAPMSPIYIDDMLDMQRDLQREFSRMDREAAQATREATREAAQMDREAAQMAREMSLQSMRDSRDVLEGTRIALRDMAPELASHAMMLGQTPMMAPMAPMAAMAPMMDFDRIAPLGDRGFGDGFRVHMPPAPWAQGDPADSLYRQARNALTSGEYGRAAKMFADISKNYPKSSYQNDAPYYEALARYKIGTTDELKQAAKILGAIASKSGNVAGATTVRAAGFDMRRNTSEGDVASLYLRINGQLAQRGDRDAAAIVSKAAATPGAPCDQDDIDVRTQALNALSTMDPAGAAPAIRHVLETKDECSAPLRRNAVFLLARRGDAESSNLLMQVAKSDPSVNVRVEAINYLSRIPGDVGLNALEDMLKNEQDERIQRAAVHALMSSDNAKARASMRSLIDRKDAPIALRIEAVNSFNSERATQDDAKYLRDLYGRADNDRLKQAIIGAVSRIGGAENDQWVIAIARNQNESSAMRSMALGQLSRSSSTISIADLGKLYDSAESYELRSRVINVLSSRKEPEATDRLIEIVKTSTVVQLRMQAINGLQRKNDPRATQLLLDILDGKRS